MRGNKAAAAAGKGTAGTQGTQAAAPAGVPALAAVAAAPVVAEPAPAARSAVLDAVDYPVIACPHCGVTDTIVEPKQDPAAAKAQGFRRRVCRGCRRTFKEPQT